MKIIHYLVLITLFLGCTSLENGENSSPIGKIESEKLSYSISVFGWKLFHQQLQETNDGVLISPLSVHTALSMTAQGAQQKTLEQMMATLECSEMKPEDLAATYRQLQEDIYKSKGSTELNGKNAVFYDNKRLTVLPDFLNTMKTSFGSQNAALDFSASKSVDDINQWASDATKGRIPTVLDEIKEDDVMFLLNALYFKGDWVIGFDERMTYESTFTKSDGKKIQRPLMNSDDVRPYFVNEELSAIGMDIKDGDYSLTMILPNEDSKSYLLDKIQKDLPLWFENITSNLKENRVLITVPKFEVKAKETLNQVLERLGMVDVFTNAANLGKLGSSPLGKLFVSRVLHDTYIKMDEKGLEGAAVTTVGVSVTSAPPHVNFDRPFIYVLSHKTTGIPVFIGLYNGN